MSEIPKRIREDIFDVLRLEKIPWAGDVGDLAFLTRIYDLSALPSNDRRYPTAFEDIRQHTVHNDDFEPDWVFEDERFELMTGSDETLLRFLTEMVHPRVRPDTNESERLVGFINEVLLPTGWELVPVRKLAGRPVWEARRSTRNATQYGDLFDRFDSFEKIGEGAFGEVFKCVANSVVTCVKRLRQTPDLEGARERFSREIRILRELSHPNVVQIISYNDATEPYWFEMEFAPHGDLAKRLQGIRYDRPVAQAVFLDICQGLKAIHDSGVVHRDLKPENVLLFEESIAKISDVGLGRHLDERSLTLTATGISMGTFDYMSPEHRVDGKRADTRSDIYSLGVLAFALCTGDSDIRGADMRSLPPPFNLLVPKMTRVNPDERFQTVDDVTASFALEIAAGSAPYTDPIADFASAVSILEAKQSSSQLGVLLQIVEDHTGDPRFVRERVVEISAGAVQRLAEWQPEALHVIVERFETALDEILSRLGWPFGLMDEWTEWLAIVYVRTPSLDTKAVCLRLLARMAFGMGQHSSLNALVAILEGAELDGEVAVASEVLSQANWSTRTLELMSGRRIHQRLRAGLSRRSTTSESRTDW